MKSALTKIAAGVGLFVLMVFVASLVFVFIGNEEKSPDVRKAPVRSQEAEHEIAQRKEYVEQLIQVGNVAKIEVDDNKVKAWVDAAWYGQLKGIGKRDEIMDVFFMYGFDLAVDEVLATEPLTDLRGVQILDATTGDKIDSFVRAFRAAER